MKTQIYNSITKENIIRDSTSEEIASINSTAISSSNRKLEEVRFQRNIRLQQTDYLASSDITMPDYIKTWRQTLRDLPANHTDEDAYNLLLARDSNGELTHSVWTQPTS
jgi:hypothetical protein